MKTHLHTLETEAGFRALFQYGTVGILVVSSRGTIELVNPNAEELFGYHKAELVGNSLEMLIPEQLRQKHENHRSLYFAKPKARSMGKGMELFARKKNGAVFPVEISLSNYELDEEMMGVAFITDITERKQAEKHLKQLNEKLEDQVSDRTLELTDALEREKQLSLSRGLFLWLLMNSERHLV